MLFPDPVGATKRTSAPDSAAATTSPCPARKSGRPKTSCRTVLAAADGSLGVNTRKLVAVCAPAARGWAFLCGGVVGSLCFDDPVNHRFGARSYGDILEGFRPDEYPRHRSPHAINSPAARYLHMQAVTCKEVKISYVHSNRHRTARNRRGQGRPDTADDGKFRSRILAPSGDSLLDRGSLHPRP